MAVFKFVVSEPETRKSYQLEVGQSKAAGIVGKKIGEEFSGEMIGLTGYSLQITGGTDKDGFPMLPAMKGPGRKKVILTSPPGFYPKLKGQRRRKTVRGNTISEDIVQINVKIVKKGEKTLEELIPTKAKEKKAEAEKTEVKPKEEKPKEEPKKEKIEEKVEPKKVEQKTEKVEEKSKEVESPTVEQKSGGEKTSEKSKGSKSKADS